MSSEVKQYKTIDKFDRVLGAMSGLPDVTQTKATTCQVVTTLTGEAQTFIVQTLRQRDRGDTIFLVYVDGERSIRIAIPPEVAETIARQRDALTAKVRRKVGRDAAAARKARGEQPAFLRAKGGA